MIMIHVILFNNETKLIAFTQFHAEKCAVSGENVVEKSYDNGDVYEYETYLKTRPSTLELNAIELVTRVAEKYDR